MRAEIALDLVYRSKLTSFQCGDQNYLFFVCGAKMACFWWGDRLTWFCVGSQNWFDIESGHRNRIRGTGRVFYITFARGMQLVPLQILGKSLRNRWRSWL